MTDKLPPEVAEAIEVFAGEAVCVCHEAYTSRGMKDPACNHDLAEYVETIRTELHRLTDENARLRVEVECDEKRVLDAMDAIHEQDQAISVAEAERDALRKRIADAPVAMAYASATRIPMAHMNRLPARLIGKRVALVLVKDAARD